MVQGQVTLWWTGWHVTLAEILSNPEHVNADTAMDREVYTEIMRRYQQGDKRAAEELIELLTPRLYRFYLSQTDSRAYADDLVQECWLRIHKARHTYRLNEPFLPWFYSLARHARVDEFRKRSRVARHEQGVDLLPERPRQEHEPYDGKSFEELTASLPESQREVLRLMKVDGLSLEDVARVTATTVGAVKQKVHRAYEKIRKQMGEGTGR